MCALLQIAPAGQTPRSRLTKRPPMPRIALLKPLPAVLVTMTLLTGCASQVSDRQVICPAITVYSPTEQQKMLQEYQQLPRDSALKRALGDYANLRDQVRACRGLH